MTDQKTVT